MQGFMISKVMIYDVAIIGAGASGLMLSSMIDKKKVVLIEQNNKIGKKLSICGGGKCNITNKSISPNKYISTDFEFLEQLFLAFSNNDLIHYLQSYGIKTYIKNSLVKGQYFLDSCNILIEFFNNKIKENNTKLLLNHQVLDISKDNLFNITTNHQIIKSKIVVIASGGLSYPILGVSDIGFSVAKRFNITTSMPSPALVGWTVQKEQFWFKHLSGISINIKLKINDKISQGSMLFTHKGCSGPVILNGSLYRKKGQVTIDFIPNIDLEQIIKSKIDKKISNAIRLPKRFMQEFLKSIKIADKSIKLLTKDEVSKLKLLKNYSFAPAGNFGWTKAEITQGGVRVDNLTNYFESKKIKNLFFIGEIVDIVGEIGGYNLQFAFSSAYRCSQKIMDCE